MNLSHDSKAPEDTVNSEEHEEDDCSRRDHSGGGSLLHVKVNSRHIDLEGERVQENRDGREDSSDLKF